MRPSLPVVENYNDVLEKCKEIYMDAQVSLAKHYWRLGQIINEAVGDRADYGKGTVKKLAEDMQIDISTLNRARQFAFRIGLEDIKDQLTWSHYRYLLSVDDTRSFKSLEEKAATENLTIKCLREEIDKRRNKKLDKVTRSEIVSKGLFSRLSAIPKSDAISKIEVLRQSEFDSYKDKISNAMQKLQELLEALNSVTIIADEVEEENIQGTLFNEEE